MVDGVDDKQAGDMDQAEEADIEDAEGARVAPRDATLLTLFSDCPPPVPRRATHHSPVVDGLSTGVDDMTTATHRGRASRVWPR